MNLVQIVTVIEAFLTEACSNKFEIINHGSQINKMTSNYNVVREEANTGE